MKLLSFFSGIGAFEKALDKLEMPYDLVAYCEIDKYASKSYSAIHGVDESMNLGDITKVDEKALPKDIDLVCYGFPCQDISLSGHMRGLFNEDGSLTRSGLFFEALRIIEETQPRVAIAENVKNLTSKKFAEQFKIVLDSLNESGYNNYWQVLNARDYGIPQNRERVFIVSIRKDIDTGTFRFPKGFPLELRLKDMLEQEVDEKYFLSDKAIEYICATGTKNFSYRPEIDLEVARPLTSTMHKQHRASADNYVSEVFVKDGQKAEIENGKPIIKVREATKKGYDEAEVGDYISIERPNSTTRRGRVGHGVSQCLDTHETHCVVTSESQMKGGLFLSEKGKKYILSPKRGMCTDINADVCQTLTAKGQNNWTGSFVSPDIKNIEKSTTIGSTEPTQIHLKDGTTITSDDDVSQLRIRKLTPKECFRLMGFDDEDFAKAEAVNSNTQLYKQAGNSIVVDVLVYLFKELFDSGAFDGESKNALYEEGEQMSFSDIDSFERYLKYAIEGGVFNG